MSGGFQKDARGIYEDSRGVLGELEKRFRKVTERFNGGFITVPGVF